MASQEEQPQEERPPEDVKPKAKKRPLRHRTLYIPSGDVVLRAEDKSKQYLYRVHRATLAHLSPVLATSLASLSASDSADQYDGAPVLGLSDSQVDVKAFLEVVYGHEHLYMKRHDPDAALFAIKVLKLAAKYDCRDVRDRVVRHIEADWPRSPAEWFAKHNMRKACFEAAKFLSQGVPAENMFPEPASVIRLAQDYDIPSVLPAAYLELVSISRRNDWDKLRKKNDDSSDESESEDEDEREHRNVRPSPQKRSARWRLLDDEDFARLRRGKQELKARCIKVREVVFNVPTGSCIGPSLDCQSELKYHKAVKTLCDMNDWFVDSGVALGSPGQLEGMRQLVFDGKYFTSQERKIRPDPLALLQDIFECVPDYGLCYKCTEGVRQNIAREMQKIWDDLPAIFDLPTAASSKSDAQAKSE